jgi:hypothetical protein
MRVRGTGEEGEVLERPASRTSRNTSKKQDDRPSLVEMTREQYEGLLARALRRPREDR